MTDSDVELKRLAERVGRHLLKARRRAATAESCTGGWIAKALTDIAGSSDWFTEGFVTYSNESKVRRLGVPRAVLQRHGAVSEGNRSSHGGGRSSPQSGAGRRGSDRHRRAGRGRSRQTCGHCLVGLGHAPRRRDSLTTALRRFRGDRETVRRKTVRAALQGLLKR